jgi:hypothetical protein
MYGDDLKRLLKNVRLYYKNYYGEATNMPQKQGCNGKMYMHLKV